MIYLLIKVIDNSPNLPEEQILCYYENQDKADKRLYKENSALGQYSWDYFYIKPIEEGK